MGFEHLKTTLFLIDLLLPFISGCQVLWLYRRLQNCKLWKLKQGNLEVARKVNGTESPDAIEQFEQDVLVDNSASLSIYSKFRSAPN